jgi:hypothetical protein
MLATSMYASTVQLSLPSDLSQWSTLEAGVHLANTAGSSDSLNYHRDISTTGPVRSGYIQIQTGGPGGFVTFAQGQLRLGFAGGPVVAPGSEYNGVYIEAQCGDLGCSPGNGYYGYYDRIPVTLGTAMTLEAVGNIAYCCTGPGVYYTGGGISGIFQFRFFDSDGVTPVAVSDAPEPSTYGLIVASMAGAVFFRRRLATILNS